jgi:hypothetical protein
MLMNMWQSCNSSVLLLLACWQAPGDEPVWRQLLRLLVDCGDPEVAQQAAAALTS